MKIGLLSDIHGNALALKAVLDSAKNKGVEMLCIAGDFVGYYYHPEVVLQLLESWRVCAVRGNHEEMLADVLEDPSRLENFGMLYGSGLKQAVLNLTKNQLEYLCTLPETQVVDVDGRRIFLAHGAPWSTDYYIYPDAKRQVFEKACLLGGDVLVLGHTHYAMKKQVGTTLIVNPGSVGQPRDRVPGAAWAMLDTSTLGLIYYRETYDKSVVVAEVTERDPSLPYLSEVLVRTHSSSNGSSSTCASSDFWEPARTR